MGWGDDLMFLGAVQAQNKPIAPTRKNKPKKVSLLWQGEPLISQTHTTLLDEMLIAPDGKWQRPYAMGVDYAPIPGKVKLTPEEITWAEEHKDFILLCPDAKPNAHHHNNKHWPWWQELADILHKDYNLLRVKSSDKQTDMQNVTNIMSPSIRHSYSIVKNARCVITTDGFWHHSSAGHDTKCIVIYGGITSPKHLGYPGQLNIVSDEHGPCYTLHRDCDECLAVMKSITAEQIADKLYSYL